MKEAAHRSRNSRTICAVAAFAVITNFASGQLFAQWADQSDALHQEATSLYRAGDLSGAIEKQKQLIEKLDFEQHPADAWFAIETLFVMCQAPGMPGFTLDLDVDCMEWVSPYLNKLPLIANDRQITALRVLYFMAIPFVFMDDDEWLRAMFDKNILEGQEQIVDTIYYVNRQLLAAEAHIALDEFSEARTAVERALGSILAIKNGHHDAWQVSRWLLAACNIYLELNDIRMAQSLLAASSPLIFRSFAPDSADMLAAHSIAAAVFFKAAAPRLAHNHSDEIVRLVDRLADVDGRYDYVRDHALSVRLGSCIIIGDSECVENIGSNDKQNVRVSAALRSPEQATNYSLLEYVAVRSIALWLIGDSIPEEERQKTITLLEIQLPRVSTSNIESLLRFGLMALRLQNDEKEQAFAHVVSVAKSTISEFRLESKAMAGHIPIPPTDRWIMWMLILNMSIGAESNAEYRDLIVAMASGLQRTSINVEGDFLSLIANTNSEYERQVAHSYLRTTSRQRSFYTALANNLVERILHQIDNDPASGSEPLTYDFATRRQVSEYGQRRARLYGQVATQSHAVSALPSLDQVQSVLELDEALLLHTTFSGVRVAVCVRSDDVQLSGTTIDDVRQVAMDVKLIKLALDGRHAASIELDRQFPVKSAVRLHKLTLGLVEDCLREGDTVYVSGRTDSFPWEVLLEEIPGELGDGYDLANAKWALKKFSFAYFGTSLEFVSGKLVDKRGRQSSGLFGIGDPILEGKTGDGASRRGVIQRGMLIGEGQSMTDLEELPETAIELESIGNLFDDNQQILTRENATEAHMRRSRLEEYEYLSFATHGLTREEISGLKEAALVLTPVAANSSLNDGLLTASEIADLRLNARVAFLSACNTSSIDTDLFKSEVQSFSAAFATAGVPATISTLSYVDSLTARVIAEKTFKHLIEEGESVAKALAAAKVEFVENPPSPEYSHPRFWAPIVSIGNSLPRNSDTLEPLLAFGYHKTVSERGGEVRRIVRDPTTNELFLRYSGNPVRRDDQDGREELQTFVARIDLAGETEWTWTRLGSGSSSVLLDMGDTLFVPGAGVAEIRDGIILRGFAELNALDKKTGLLRWSKQIKKHLPSAWPAGGLVTSDNQILLLLAQWDSTDLDGTDTDFSLIKFSPTGDEIFRKTFPSIVSRLDLASNVSMIEDAGKIYLAFSKSTREENYDPSWDDFHNPNSCYIRTHTNVWQLDSETLEVIDKQVFLDRAYSSAVPKPSGGFFLVGHEFKNCLTQSRLIVSELQQGQITQDFHDQMSNDSVGKDIVVLQSGKLLVVGHEKHRLASRKYTSLDEESSLDEFSFDRERIVEETSMDGLVILLTQDLREEGRDWLEGGADVSFTTGLEKDGSVLLGGLNGSTGELTLIKIGADQ